MMFHVLIKELESEISSCTIFVLACITMDFMIIFSCMHTSALSSHLPLSYGPTGSLPLPKSSPFSCHICAKFQTHPAQIAGRWSFIIFLFILLSYNASQPKSHSLYSSHFLPLLPYIHLIPCP